MLVDASAYLFRAWFGVPDVFEDRRGRPLNAVVGFAATLGRLLAGARPARVAVAFDEALFTGFRHRIDPDYKAGRVLPDAGLAWQMKACRRLVEGLGIAATASQEFEADDLLATLAAREAAKGGFSVVAGEDKDLAQVLGPRDHLWQFARRRVMDADAAGRWLGLPVSRLPELQALVGDPVDGIVGVPGVGRRTALLLLAECGHVEELLRAPGRVAELPVRGAARLSTLLAMYRESVRRNLRLTTLSKRATGLPRWQALSWQPPVAEDVSGLVRRLDLPAGTARHFCYAPVSGSMR